MESGAKDRSGGPSPQPTGSEPEDPRFRHAREASGGEKGREMLEHAAMGAELSEDEERSGLDWLLGTSQPVVHEVPVDYETPSGTTKLIFVLRQMDARKIDEIEQRHISAGGVMDRFSADCEIVAESTVKLIDAKGQEVEPTSEKFRTFTVQTPDGPKQQTDASTPRALERRFSKQLGLIQGVAQEVRRAAGFDPQRVGKAQRRLVEASLG